jgi:hypothetical protein
MRPCPIPLLASDNPRLWTTVFRSDGWPGASSFPDLEGCSEVVVGVVEVLDWQRLSGIGDEWCSGTSFPALG